MQSQPTVSLASLARHRRGNGRSAWFPGSARRRASRPCGASVPSMALALPVATWLTRHSSARSTRSPSNTALSHPARRTMTRAHTASQPPNSPRAALYGWASSTRSQGRVLIRLYLGGKPEEATPSAPFYSFGAADRATTAKVFISQAHTLTIRAGTQGPGPKQAAAHRRREAAECAAEEPAGWKLVGKLAPRRARPRYARPGAIPQAHGKQPDAGHRSEPSWTIASKARTPVEPGTQSPGPSTTCRRPTARRSAPGIDPRRRCRFHATLGGRTLRGRHA